MRNRSYPLYEQESVNDLKELLARSANKFGDRPAFQYMEGGQLVSVSYSRMQGEVNALGTALYALGHRGGRHIAVLSENSYRYALAAFAAMNGSNVFVPIDKDLPAEQVKDRLAKGDCSVLFYSDTYHDIIESLRGQLQDVELINMKRAYEGIAVFDDLMRDGESRLAGGDRAFVYNKIDNTALAAIFFTSGTTAGSKGVMLSQKNMAVNAVDSMRMVGLGAKNILLLPIHHAFGFTANILAMIYLGSCICVSRSLKYLAEELKQFQPEHLILVPLFVETLSKRIWDNAAKQGKAGALKFMMAASNFLLKFGIDLRAKLFAPVLAAFGGKLKVIACGGAFLDASYSKEFRSFGLIVDHGYGITECSPIVSGNRNLHFNDESVGLVFPSCEVKIADYPGANSGEGEILVRGDYVMLGYYKNEQATAEAMQDGWFRTGDIGRLDEDGFLYITGRIKNVIILGNGENVYPEELEEAIRRLRLIKEVVVRADEAGQGKSGNAAQGRPGNVPLNKAGSGSHGKTDALTAEIFPDYDAAEAQGVEDLRVHIEAAIAAFNKELPLYKHIQNVVLRDSEFDKTTTKKIKRW